MSSHPSIDEDPAHLIPQLLDQLIVLRELAKHVSQALSGNGHRPEAVDELIHFVGNGQF